MTTTTDIEHSGAPGELELVRKFVNSHDHETGEEELTSPAALATWLEKHDLAASNRAKVRAFRERHSG